MSEARKKFEKLLDTIESGPFATNLSAIAPDVASMIRYADGDPAVQALKTMLAKNEGRYARLKARIMAILARDFDRNFINPGDTAITLYLHWVHAHDLALAHKLAAWVTTREDFWWARRLVQSWPPP